jgi:hypothetical protein
MTRRRILAGAVALVALVAMGALVARLSNGSDEEASHPSLSGSARPRACPEFEIRGLPAGLVLRDRRLVNLGRGRLGRVQEYGDGQRLLAFYAGVDVLEALEDVDFEQITMRAGDRVFLLNRTRLVPGLLVANWTEPVFRRPCSALAVRSEGFTESELLQVVAGTALQGK